jgi:hypothetical protein
MRRLSTLGEIPAQLQRLQIKVCWEYFPPRFNCLLPTQISEKALDPPMQFSASKSITIGFAGNAMLSKFR